MSFQNLDADQTIFFKRELELIKSRVFEKKYKELQFRRLFPIANEGGPGIESVTVRSYDKSGMAKIISGMGDDLPRADVSGKEYTVPVVPIGTSFGYNVKEIAAAAKTGKPLQTMKADAARRAVEEKLNNIAFGVDEEATDAGMLGLFSHPNIPTSNVVNGGGGFPQWDTKTPDEIIFDINDAFADIMEATKMRERPTRILLPFRQWNYLASTRLTDVGMTVMQFIVANSPYITSADQIMPVLELEGAGTGGVDVMVCYDPDPDKLEMDIPMELQFLPVQEKGLEFLVPGWCNAGGLNVYRPLSLIIKEGI